MHEFTRDDLTFDVIDGGPERGPAVVLLHGFPQDHHAFDAVAVPLQEAGLRTLAPLQRGYAEASTPARDLGVAAYAVPELVADVVAMLDAAGVERAHVVGHDWGGLVAWALATAEPERVATLTVLSTPHPSAMAWASRHGGQWRKSWYIGAFQVPWLPERVLGALMPKALRDSRLPEPLVRRYASSCADTDRARAMLGWYRALRVPPPEGAPRGPVRVPTTYLWGRHDLALGRAAAERTARHVEGDYLFTEVAAGHWLPETEPDLVARTVLERIRSA